MQNNYSSLQDVIVSTRKNEQFTSTFIVGLIFFITIQIIAERVLYPKLSTVKQRLNVSKMLIGTYLQSLIHSIICCMKVSIIGYKMYYDIDDMNYIFIAKILMTFSLSYFIIGIPFEWMTPNVSRQYRLFLTIHHILAALVALTTIMINDPPHHLMM